MLAKNVVAYFNIYLAYLQEHGLDDSNSISVNKISVKRLINFVENEIDEENRIRLGWTPTMYFDWRKRFKPA